MPYTIARNTSAAARLTTLNLGSDLTVSVTQPGSTLSGMTADLNGDGVADLLWRNSVTGEVRFSSLDGFFAADLQSLPIHSDLLWKLVAIGDFDGDGHSDLLWRNGRTGELSMDLVGNAGATSVTVTPEATTYAKIAGAGDLDGDGKADLVIRNQDTGAVSVRLMNGASTLNSATVVTSSTRDVIIVAVADLNGDGKADLVTYNRTTGEVRGRMMNGTATVSEGTIATEADVRWQVAAAGDVNGDGKADLLWRNRSTGAVEIQIMNGLVAASRVAIATDADTRWELLGTGDVNGDGKADLLWRYSATGAVRVDLMDGTQLTGSSTVYSEPDLSWKLVTAASAPRAQEHARADFAPDGTSDIMWRNSTTNEIAMWEMNGTAILNGNAVATLSVPANTLQGAGDFDGDGTCDLLWRNRTSNAVSVWQMNGHTLTAGKLIATLADANWQIQAIGDVTGDGVDDVVLRNNNTNAVALWQIRRDAQGNLTIQGSIIATLSDANWQIQGTGDFYGDGHADVLWRNPVTGYVAIWQIEAGAITSQTFAIADTTWVIQAVGDYNGHGRSDILWRSPANAIHIWEMNGNATPNDVTVGTLADPNWKIQATTGDVGADGVWDIIFRHAVNSNVAIWQMKGSAIRSAAAFASAGSDWIMEALERNGNSGTWINALSVATATQGGAPWWTPAHGGGPPFSVPGGPPQAPWTTPPPGFVHTPFWTPPTTPLGTIWWTPLTGATPPLATSIGSPSAASATSLASARDNAHDESRPRPTPRQARRFQTPETFSTTANRRYSLYTPPELHLLAETTATSAAAPAIAYEYVWFGDRPIAQIETPSHTTHYYFTDHLGTPLLTTNTTAAVDWRLEREPFGTRYAVRAGATRYQPLAFPGQEEDGTSDRAYNIFRWYRAGWGRYTQADPIGIRGGYNLLQYAGGDPLNSSDRLGLEIKRCFRPFSNPGTKALASGVGAATGWFVIQPPVPGVSKCLMHEYLYNTETQTSQGFDPKEIVKESGKDICYTIPEPIGTCVWENFSSTAGPMDKYNLFNNNCQTTINETVKKCTPKLCLPKSPAAPGNCAVVNGKTICAGTGI